MRILFVINAFVRAGAEKLVMDLSQVLAESCEYVGIAALYPGEAPTQETLRCFLEERGIHTWILDKRAGKDRLETVRKLAKIVRENHVELIHGHCSVPMLMGKLAGLVTGTPVVSTVHSTKGYSVKRERLTGWMSSAYVSICATAEEYMIQTLHIPKKKITRIYNAVDGATFSPSGKKEGFWTQWGLDETHPVVVNVGRVVWQKNQMCFLRGLKRCLDQGRVIQGVILGGFDPTSEQYREMDDYIQKNGLEPYIRFLGQQERVQDFLANADCFVMTSVVEGMSVSFLEAVFCGVPIVVTQMPFVEELHKIAPCGRIIGMDDDRMLSQVLMEGDYAPPPPSTQEMFRACFSMETYGKEHLELYRKILGAKQKEGVV